LPADHEIRRGQLKRRVAVRDRDAPAADRADREKQARSRFADTRVPGIFGTLTQGTHFMPPSRAASIAALLLPITTQRPGGREIRCAQ